VVKEGFVGKSMGITQLRGGSTTLPSQANKKIKKVIKNYGRDISLVVGKDVKLDIMDLDGKSLVGKFAGRKVVNPSLGV
jgi:hypothetical protein